MRVIFSISKKREQDFLKAFLNRKMRINFILARAECDYVAQAFAAQTLTVKSSIVHIGTKSFTMVHEIYEKDVRNAYCKSTCYYRVF